MIQTVLDNLTSTEANVRLAAAVEAGQFADGLKTLDGQTKRDFSVLARQAESYPDWPESEQSRFRRLVQSVRNAALNEGKLFDAEGNPIWKA